MTVTTPDTRLPASLLTTITGRRFRISPPIVASSVANQMSPRRIVFDAVGAGRFEDVELLFLPGGFCIGGLEFALEQRAHSDVDHSERVAIE